MNGEIVKQDKSWSQSFVDRAKQELASAPAVSAAVYVRETASTAVEYTEAGVVGGMLGATHAKFGLDGPLGPTDAWVAALGAIFGVAASGHFPALAARARGVGAKALTVLAFRKSYELVKHEPLGGAVTPGVQRVTLPGKGPGVAGEDPIEAVARALG
jgi:hypothetical protein